MSEPIHYVGSCHCGRVRYEVTASLDRVMACNCSMCGRAGTLLSFVPAQQFKLISGSESLADYQFNKMHIHHLFCTTCGIKPFARGISPGGGGEMMAVNVRCLEGVDLEKLPVKHFDGRSL